jgi:hypothetical protein
MGKPFAFFLALEADRVRLALVAVGFAVLLVLAVAGFFLLGALVTFLEAGAFFFTGMVVIPFVDVIQN